MTGKRRDRHAKELAMTDERRDRHTLLRGDRRTLSTAQKLAMTIFLSLRTPEGGRPRVGVNGKGVWQSRICYFVDNKGEIAAQ
jgi:hypothetical protein